MSVIFLCLICGGALATPDTTEVYEYVLSWGGLGSGPGEFNNPNRMGSDRYGNLYVGDKSNFRVQKFDSLGNFLMMFGEPGMEPGQFVAPRDVAVSGDGYIYICDYDSYDADPSWVHKFDSLGNFILRWGGAPGLGPGELYAPLSIAIGDSGYVFVADLGHRIQRFTPDGNFDLFWTHPDTSVHGGDAVGSFPGSVYTEWATGADYLFRHDPTGNIVLSFAASGEVGYPKDMATDSDGNLYVTDWWNTRVVKFDSLGNLITMWGESGPEPWQFGSVAGIAVDLYGSAYIADPTQDRIHKYRRTIVKVNYETTGGLDQPFRVRLAQNYPNPFTTYTILAYAIDHDTDDSFDGLNPENPIVRVRLEIFNLLGQLVRTLVDRNQVPGKYTIIWDGRSDAGQRAASGIYVYQLHTADRVLTRRCVLIR